MAKHINNNGKYAANLKQFNLDDMTQPQICGFTGTQDPNMNAYYLDSGPSSLDSAFGLNLYDASGVYGSTGGSFKNFYRCLKVTPTDNIIIGTGPNSGGSFNTLYTLTGGKSFYIVIDNQNSTMLYEANGEKTDYPCHNTIWVYDDTLALVFSGTCLTMASDIQHQVVATDAFFLAYPVDGSTNVEISVV
jgi:hypothetical protein